jgi:predicted aconitase/predicted aconitase with swiveling domain
MSSTTLKGRSLVSGSAEAILLRSDVALSFWGGVDATNGDVIDQHHPLKGQNVAGKILAIPSGRGSCTGSSVLLELILNDCAPAALIFSELEEILTLGVVVADVMFDKTLPIIQLSKTDFQALCNGSFMQLDNHILTQSNTDKQSINTPKSANIEQIDDVDQTLQLSTGDQTVLAGEHGKASQVAMQILVRMARIQGANRLLDVSQAHIDGCVYNGPSSLRFARKLNEWGAQVRVPTTLNSISVDQRRWRQQGIEESFGEPASQLGDAYMQMGAQMSYTCAPYLLDTAPKFGEQIVWAESNAVVYANSVLGARTQKYADFMDICIALTGRAPYCGSHMDAGRLPTLAIVIEPPTNADDAYWPLLGYHVGLLAVNDIPILYGLEKTAPSSDDLKGFSAAFATTSSASMFHISAVTPESSIAHQHVQAKLSHAAIAQVNNKVLSASWHELNTATQSKVDVICLGNPHFSLSECSALATLCSGRQKHNDVKIYVTLGRAIYNKASESGFVDALENFGVEFITDTCWCMLTKPVIPELAQVLMTNSGKYAHYAPGLVGKSIYFDSLSKCVEAACTSRHTSQLPVWITTSTD